MNSTFSQDELLGAALRPSSLLAKVSFGFMVLLLIVGLMTMRWPIAIGGLLGSVTAAVSVCSFVYLAGAMGSRGRGGGAVAVLLLLLKIPILVLILLFLNALGVTALLAFAIAMVLVYSGAVANLGQFGLRRRHFFDRHG